MSHTVTKRKATETDTFFAKQTLKSAYRDVAVKQFGKWDEGMQEKWHKETWLPKPNDIILCDGFPCGYCSIEYKPDHIFVNELVIAPEFQNRGIGTQVLSELISEAKEKKLPIRLQVLKENKARFLYQRLGFKDTGTTETHLQMELVH
jgi:ribosomal protein S18 acetylase RimI-like enzyme